jgi:alanine racemase
MPLYPVTRAEISRSRLIGNFARLRSLIRETPDRDRCDLVAVVKGNAYGHSAAICAPWLVEAGAQWLGVTSVEEGIAVRKFCPQPRILVMRCLLPEEVEGLLEARLTPTIWDIAHLDLLAEATRHRSFASGSVPVHLEIDSGMTRQGVSCRSGELAAFLDRLRAIPTLRLEGVYTHFASAEMLDSEQNRLQMACFQHSVEQIAAAGFHPQWVHGANSSTLLGQQMLEPLAALAKKVNAQSLVRPGIALYGYALPFVRDVSVNTKMPVELEPVLTWKTAIASMRTVEAGAKVGYGATFIAPREMRLGLLPVGYADGLNRKLSSRKTPNGGHVLIRGMAAPIVGRVSMDLTIVDVSNVPDAATGDEVMILGEQNGQRITADDHARWAETISYEILCAIGARVRRVACE